MYIGHKGILGVGMYVAVGSSPFFTAEVLVRSWDSPYGFSGGHSVTGKGFAVGNLGFTCHFSLYQRSIFHPSVIWSVSMGPLASAVPRRYAVCCMLIPPHEWKTIRGLLYCFVFRT